MEKYDYQNEPGVQDATYQDFVAPTLLGLGMAPRLMASSAPAIARGLTAGIPAAEKMAEERAPNATTVEDILQRFMDKAQEIGDFTRLFKYKALRTAMGETQMPTNEVLNTIQKIHAD